LIFAIAVTLACVGRFLEARDHKGRGAQWQANGASQGQANGLSQGAPGTSRNSLSRSPRQRIDHRVINSRTKPADQPGSAGEMTDL
jgi:hypothetical protein